ncbi:HoxN/HupN/NixA family nickel/cobalt transporter [Klebsiella pneumoniae subsp. ozaenae]|uniref:Nickel/cobalt efflux system n=1 Tax=Klebsiella pneumoniae subsp. ozaenae TaxID=574 RepID=A0A378AFE6_KLEPO|nr:HoxN/HupN/NixA family nickel/cobalt transporter [Klebsiella pneumoniae subsp. ozaenae]
MIMTVLRQQPRAAGLVLGLIAANLLAWCWALQAFGDSGALMAASLLAWGYGLRHAVDADHIAAIDNVTRKMMQQGRRPFAVGRGFRWATHRLWCWPRRRLPRPPPPSARR